MLAGVVACTVGAQAGTAPTTQSAATPLERPKLDALAGRYPPPGEAEAAYVPASNATLIAYEQLTDDFDNPDFPVEKLAEAVFKGVHNHDLRVADSTVRALAEDALAVNLADVLAEVPLRRTRAFSAVPGLRGFLAIAAAPQ